MARVANAGAAYADGCSAISDARAWSWTKSWRTPQRSDDVDFDDDRRVVGDQYTFVALDPDTKLVVSWLVGERTADTTRDFICDLHDRLKKRVQISTDGFEPYVQAISEAFGSQL